MTTSPPRCRDRRRSPPMKSLKKLFVSGLAGAAIVAAGSSWAGAAENIPSPVPPFVFETPQATPSLATPAVSTPAVSTPALSTPAESVTVDAPAIAVPATVEADVSGPVPVEQSTPAATPAVHEDVTTESVDV